MRGAGPRGGRNMKVGDLTTAAYAYARRTQGKVNAQVMERVVSRMERRAVNATTGKGMLDAEVTADDVVRLMYNALLHPTWH